ncbi:MAG: Aldo/keto reductase [Cyanobacteriota bacterium erpe_2018_sw_21hr_WHONDRS-SW48-000092_B_bin.40]|jgi:aryl-alcohol dehydrogenase-like predicted oxidoreductase|nr:Aldo/keto reductase [Cyanobacteriota bacterium erpe_2018_sw_21hr_WHONDRS-SW48-000092_B_bin.40]
MLPLRKLGQQGLEVTALGLGCMGMSWLYGTPDRLESVRTLKRAIALGINFFDTAEVYGPYDNEELLGEVLRGRRDDVIIATKFGFDISMREVIGVDSHPRNIKRACEDSLKRLNTDYIDLFYQHRVDPGIPIEEVAGTMGELVEQGKVRYIGLSEASAENIRKAHRTFPLTCVQSEYSLWERSVEERVLPTLRELGIGFVPYSPLGRGLLAGQIKNVDQFEESDYRRNDPRYQGDNFSKNLKIVNEVKHLARRYEASPAQMALAWLLQKGQDIVPIPGTKKVKYLEENVEALELELSGEDLEELDAISRLTAGARYEPARMERIDQ